MDEGSTQSIEPRTVQAGRGVNWWTEAWAMFMKNPGMWSLFGLILLVLFGVLGVVHVIGSVASSLLAPVFVGSLLLAARKSESGAALELGDLFSGFGSKVTPLLVIGALLLAAGVVIMALVGALGLGAMVGMTMGSHSSGPRMGAAMGAGMLAMLVMLVCGAIVVMALWFAPALVVFRDVPPIEALKASIRANLKNIVPFLLYGVLYIVASIVASIPFGLGWIVLIPLGLLTQYIAYQDVFGEPAAV